MWWKTQNKKVVSVDSDKCNGCGKCVKMCRSDVLEIVIVEGERRAIVSHIDKCRGCEKCTLFCKQKAIELKTVI